jgi:hypothetical protein
VVIANSFDPMHPMKYRTLLLKYFFMRNKNNKTPKNKTSSKRKKDISQSHEYETMSQIQNRYGKGREHSGSDGSSNEGRGSNH